MIHTGMSSATKGQIFNNNSSNTVENRVNVIQDLFGIRWVNIHFTFTILQKIGLNSNIFYVQKFSGQSRGGDFHYRPFNIFIILCTLLYVGSLFLHCVRHVHYIYSVQQQQQQSIFIYMNQHTVVAQLHFEILMFKVKLEKREKIISSKIYDGKKQSIILHKL